MANLIIMLIIWILELILFVSREAALYRWDLNNRHVIYLSHEHRAGTVDQIQGTEKMTKGPKKHTTK